MVLDDRPAGTASLVLVWRIPGPRGIRIVVDEPAKAEQLHDKRGQEHKQQREAEVGVLTLQVIGGRQPQVRGAVGEERAAQHPTAVRSCVARPRAPPPPSPRAPRLPLPPPRALLHCPRLLRPPPPAPGRLRPPLHPTSRPCWPEQGGERLPGGGGVGCGLGRTLCRRLPPPLLLPLLLPPP